MADRIILLTEAVACEALLTYVRARAGLVPVVAACDKAQLAALIDDTPPGRGGAVTRLIAFCTPVIVAREQIARLGLTPYNIHPGLPAYPGVHPDAFAHADGAPVFGATAHELTAEIDAGPIVAIAEADIRPGAAREDYAEAAYSCALDLFRLVVNQCLAADLPLPAMPDVTWAGRRNRLSDYRARFGAAA